MDVTKPDPKKDPPRDYPVPNFGQDADVTNTLNHAAAAESRLGMKMMQVGGVSIPEDTYVKAMEDLHMESDPICSSAGCT